MGLVGYSDSESDSEVTVAQPLKASRPSVNATATFQPLPPASASAPRRIKVELPSAAVGAGSVATEENAERPAKRARTAGNLSGFNALLPAPKRADDAQKRRGVGLGSGVSLKTSGAAAFSREPVSPAENCAIAEAATNGTEEPGSDRKGTQAGALPDVVEEVKVVGNPMRFKPLSVANKKRGVQPVRKTAQAVNATEAIVKDGAAGQKGSSQPARPAEPVPKPKVSLFGVGHDESSSRSATSIPAASNGFYKPLMTTEDEPEEDATNETGPHTNAAASGHTQSSAPGSLSAIASDLNLSEADRRRLFGRNGAAQAGITVADFNMDREYTRNEQLRAAGEQTEHRAVRSVAPGKHSLQQLVNASTNQREALEDKWAQGKRNRGEAGDKYGWGGR